jgi:dipeptidyl aminopeptidase/acylaminoacyl peptidase
MARAARPRDALSDEWSNPRQPPKTVATLPAEISDVIAAPDGKRVAVFQIRRANDKLATSADRIWLVLWDRAASAHHELVADAESPFAAQWSPDGQSLAVALHLKLDAKTASIVRVYDAQTRRAIASTDPGLDVNIHGWSGRELLLVHSEHLKEPPVHDLYTWTPGSDPPKRASTPPPILSPDGRYAVSIDGDTLRVRDTTSPDAERTFRATQPDDKLALENLEVPPTFLGPHGLLFAAEETFVLNLATLKLQRAFPRDDLSENSVSPDGRRMVLENRDEELFFAELE